MPNIVLRISQGKEIRKLYKGFRYDHVLFKQSDIISKSDIYTLVGHQLKMFNV